MIRITITHWSGIRVTIEGSMSTSGMGRKGPTLVMENLGELQKMVNTVLTAITIE